MPEEFVNPVQFFNVDGGPVVVEITGNVGSGAVLVKDSEGRSAVRVFGGAGNVPGTDVIPSNVIVGTDGNAGAVSVHDNSDGTRVLLLGSEGEIIVRDSQDREAVRITSSGNILVGVEGNAGKVSVRDNSGRARVILAGSEGEIIVRDSQNREAVRITSGASIVVGVEKNPGEVVVHDVSGGTRVRLSGAFGRAEIRNNEGDLVIVLDSEDNHGNASCTLGGGDRSGILFINDENGLHTVRLNGRNGNLRLGGGSTANGHLFLFPSGSDILQTAQAAIHLDGSNGRIRASTLEFSDGTTQTSAPIMEGIIAGDGLISRRANGNVELSIDPALISELGSGIQSLEIAVTRIETQLQSLERAVRDIETRLAQFG